jgi:hypothetical protein
MQIRIQSLLGVAVLLLLVGCRQSPSTVEGLVTLDGKPVSLKSDARGTVVFQPTGGKGTMATGVLDSTGHFTLATGAMPEVAPGKYQVAISIVELLPATDEGEQAGKRITPAKYASPIDSGLQAEVVPGVNKFQFDLTADESPEVPDIPLAAPETPEKTADGPDSANAN